MSGLRDLVLGTAGHIDHGRAASLRALTGVDTGRLPAGGQRGITIGLGFAAPEVVDLHPSWRARPAHAAVAPERLADGSPIAMAALRDLPLGTTEIRRADRRGPRSDRPNSARGGQLVEPRGSFHLPEIFEASGARLREVGTTNRTRLSDCERAIGPDTAALLRVHASSYRIVGLIESVAITELAPLVRARGLWSIDDLGSGALGPGPSCSTSAPWPRASRWTTPYAGRRGSIGVDPSRGGSRSEG